MTRPHAENRFNGSYPAASGVVRWSEPMVLRSSRRSCLLSNISHSIHCVSHNSIDEQNVVAHDSRSQVVFVAIQVVDHSVYVLVFVETDQLEGSEDFLVDQLPILPVEKLIDGNEDCRGLEQPVLFGHFKFALDCFSSE